MKRSNFGITLNVLSLIGFWLYFNSKLWEIHFLPHKYCRSWGHSLRLYDEDGFNVFGLGPFLLFMW